MMLVKLSLIIVVIISRVQTVPLLYLVPQSLTKFVTSASEASSGPVGNVADLRNGKLQEPLDDDDFFNDAAEEQQVEEASPNLLQAKIQKIIQKIRLLRMLTNFGTSVDDNAVQKPKDDFDRDFDEDFNADLVESSGYSYNKPKDIVKSEKQEEPNRNKFSPANIGVFFMELIGSLVGLAYGAAAQLNYHGSSTTASPT